mmetsp:Transcript_9404/g.17857  ORF Transcript_9404/g.17857 Transcript_9404/m.17857 type:complete len:236 (+) Transcript_9404:281-988(+)
MRTQCLTSSLGGTTTARPVQMRCLTSSLAGGAAENCYATPSAQRSSLPLWCRSKQCHRWISMQMRAANVRPVAPPRDARAIPGQRMSGIFHGGVQPPPATLIGGNGARPWDRLHFLALLPRVRHEDLEFLRRGGRRRHRLCHEKCARRTAHCVAAKRVVRQKLVFAKIARGAWLRLDPPHWPRAETGWRPTKSPQTLERFPTPATPRRAQATVGEAAVKAAAWPGQMQLPMVGVS